MARRSTFDERITGMVRERVELNLGAPPNSTPVTHLAGPRPGQPGITCSAGAIPAARP
jgi:hypothetical protein